MDKAEFLDSSIEKILSLLSNRCDNEEEGFHNVVGTSVWLTSPLLNLQIRSCTKGIVCHRRCFFAYLLSFSRLCFGNDPLFYAPVETYNQSS